MLWGLGIGMGKYTKLVTIIVVLGLNDRVTDFAPGDANLLR